MNFQRLWIPFILAIAIFAATAIIDFRAVNTLITNVRAQAAARMTAIELQNLLGLALMAETGQRGFVITGQESYLEPYHQARKELPESLALLRRTLAHDPEQLHRLNTIEHLQNMKMEELERSIQVRRQSGFAAAQQIVLTNAGKQIMDQMRLELAQMEKIESARLSKRIAQSDKSADQAIQIVVAAGILDVGLLFLLAWLVRTDSRRQQVAAERVAQAQGLLRDVIDGSPALIYLKDTASRFILVNKAFEEFFGLRPGEAVGKSTQECFPEDAAMTNLAYDRQAMEENRAIQFEEVIPAPGGNKYFASAKVPLRNQAGELIGVCGVSADVTSLKQAEAEVRRLNQTLEQRVQERTEALEAANTQLHDVNAQLEAFNYTVAHDLRAPLRGMQGFAQAVSEDYASSLDATGQDYLSRISRAATRMERLIEDLLSFSRLSRAALTLERVDLNDVMQEVLTLAATQIAQSHARIEVAPDLHAVHGNRVACIQVMQNLVSNALKFTPAGSMPHIKIESQLHQMDSDDTDDGAANWVRISVIDNGIGIPQEQYLRIFKPFERLHGMHEYPGSGIGLAIVDKTVRRMKGRCGVDSIVGKGSRFWIDLPAAETERLCVTSNKVS